MKTAAIQLVAVFQWAVQPRPIQLRPIQLRPDYQLPKRAQRDGAIPSRVSRRSAI